VATTINGTKLYLDDLRVGLRFTSEVYAIDAARIKQFASEFDPQPFHLDEMEAEGSVFRGLVASGWHTGAVTMRLLTGSVPLAGGIVGVGGEISWPQPARPGDSLHVESEILEIRPSRSKPDRGVVTLLATTFNQNQDAVCILKAKLVVPKRPAK
jgi:acyl dehydratase